MQPEELIGVVVVGIPSGDMIMKAFGTIIFNEKGPTLETSEIVSETNRDLQ